VDGYNVTMADDATRRLPRDAQRDALVRRISVRGPDLLGTGPVTVVFDGHHGEGVDAASGNVDVRYSRGESADDVIVSLAASTNGPLTVVTSDRELRERVRAAASGPVTALGCSTLFESKRPKRRRGAGRFPASTAGLPKGANRITHELKDIWLDEEE
jgi:predicted RNA-binding protein with PIN domain